MWEWAWLGVCCGVFLIAMLLAMAAFLAVLYGIFVAGWIVHERWQDKRKQTTSD